MKSVGAYWCWEATLSFSSNVSLDFVTDNFGGQVTALTQLFVQLLSPPSCRELQDLIKSSISASRGSIRIYVQDKDLIDSACGDDFEELVYDSDTDAKEAETKSPNPLAKTEGKALKVDVPALLQEIKIETVPDVESPPASPVPASRIDDSKSTGTTALIANVPRLTVVESEKPPVVEDKSATRLVADIPRLTVVESVKPPVVEEKSATRLIADVPRLTAVESVKPPAVEEKSATRLIADVPRLTAVESVKPPVVEEKSATRLIADVPRLTVVEKNVPTSKEDQLKEPKQEEKPASVPLAEKEDSTLLQEFVDELVSRAQKDPCIVLSKFATIMLYLAIQLLIISPLRPRRPSLSQTSSCQHRPFG
jgi:hypothetical protein